jgi:predicted aspartyl protease
MRPGTMRNIRFFLPCLLIASAISAQAPATPTPAAAQKLTCPIDQSMPSEGDIALAKKDYDAALTIFQSQVDKNPASAEAHLGLVRALIGKDRTADAQKTAQEMLTRDPHSVLGEVAAGEADFRAADFGSARTHVAAALKANPCEGRARAFVASLFYATAYFATEATYLSLAHRLRPNDELIRRDWIQSLPRKQRAIELDKYLAGPNALSDKDRIDAVNEQDHMKARRPGECRITSKAETVKIPFQPIVGEGSVNRPEAFGLDVSFNGKRRRMQIDTGASGIVLSPSAAKGLGLTPEFHLHAGGVGDAGDVDSYLTHVANIQIGDVQVSDCMVEVLQKTKKHDLGVDGLIGIDVFDRWLVTLDYQSAKLLLNPLPGRAGLKEPEKLNTSDAQAQQIDEDDRAPQDATVPPEMKDWLHVIRIGHELLLPASINKGLVHYMMADTGASETTLSLAYAKESGKARRDDDVRFTGVSGEVKQVYRLDNANLWFGQLRLPPQSFWAFDLTSISHDSGVEVSGFVGLPTLSRLTITIDYRDNLMLLKYDPNNDHIRF